MSEQKETIKSQALNLKKFFSRPVKAGLSILTLLIIIAFASKRQGDKIVTDVDVKVHNQKDNFFLGHDDVYNLMTLDGSAFVTGNTVADVDLKKLETRLERNDYIEQAEIYHNLAGQVEVEVWLARPLARIIPERGPASYICNDGSLIPTSHKFSSRVLIIRGKGSASLLDSAYWHEKEGKELFGLLKSIHADPFWKAQIAEFEISKRRELTIYPQVTKQYIEFGDIKQTAEKLKKLKIFYDEILPFKGWNTYERVCLKYKNQIVCE